MRRPTRSRSAIPVMEIGGPAILKFCVVAPAFTIAVHRNFGSRFTKQLVAPTTANTAAAAFNSLLARFIANGSETFLKTVGFRAKKSVRRRDRSRRRER
jgi:hypothetical protein